MTKRILAALAAFLISISLAGTAHAAEGESQKVDRFETVTAPLIDELAATENCEPAMEAMADEPLLAQSGCCRICRTGKACGDSCINRSYTCRQPPGCACNG